MLHIALLDPERADVATDIARQCVSDGAALHLVAPLPFQADDAEFLAASGDAADVWLHRSWRDFRDAISRERCIYFAADGERDAADAPFQPNSVLVFGNAALILPDRIREKYPERIFALPRAAQRTPPDPRKAVELTLRLARKQVAPPDGKPRHRR